MDKRTIAILCRLVSLCCAITGGVLSFMAANNQLSYQTESNLLTYVAILVAIIIACNLVASKVMKQVQAIKKD